MEDLLSLKEIEIIANKIGIHKTSKWKIENASDKVIGYLGEHLSLIIEDASNNNRVVKVFVKCVPRSDENKSKYIKDLQFFNKEYVMLHDVLKDFGGEDDVSQLNYVMPHHQKVMSIKEIYSVVTSIARFHAQTLIYEVTRSKSMNSCYSIYDEYKEYLTDPPKGKEWRDSGRDAVISYLKVFSKYRYKNNFENIIDHIVPQLFDNAQKMLKPSLKYKNTIVHRDLWTNNIFLKYNFDDTLDVLLIDYQTVVYCSPMVDLAALLYFTTDRTLRNNYTKNIIHAYYKVLEEELDLERININDYFTIDILQDAYNEAILFGITQACIILPITVMDDAVRNKLFADPETSNKVNQGSRCQQIIEAAKCDKYRERITYLFDELVERYIKF